MNEYKVEVAEAFKMLELIISADAVDSDSSYYEMHKTRYERMIAAITNNVAPGGLILDIGSHYLHTSLILTFLGYKVYSMDVTNFHQIPFVKKRVQSNDLTALVNDNLENPIVLDEYSDIFDCVIFSETLEHITFNPINFWKTIHRITKVKGLIYLSTPNSMNLFNVLNSIKRIILLDGIGISVKGIFSSVTYGHHWKEYSKREIKEYFNFLSKDFIVQIKKYSYRKYPRNGIKNILFYVVRAIGNSSYIFADELEVIVSIKDKTTWLVKSPAY
jgi:2-polyprenyl-3-methyl-5-hydroxy-6-metoxy-1,4-benzoquinol methylase